jgi:hypothetical protein
MSYIEADEQLQESPITAPSDPHGPDPKAEETTTVPDIKIRADNQAKGFTIRPEIQVNNEDIPKVNKTSVTAIVNPLFSRTGSVTIEEENNGDVQVRKPLLRKRATTRTKKAATASKFKEVTNQFQTKVTKENAVVIDYTLLASDMKATVSPP